MSAKSASRNRDQNRDQLFRRFWEKLRRRAEGLLSVYELVERATRIELVTSSLGSWHSTAELRPLCRESKYPSRNCQIESPTTRVRLIFRQCGSIPARLTSIGRFQRLLLWLIGIGVGLSSR